MDQPCWAVQVARSLGWYERRQFGSCSLVHQQNVITLELPMRRFAALLLIAVLPTLAFTCDPTSPDGNVEVRFVEDGLLVSNDTGATIFYTAVNPRSLVLWAVCTDPASCPSIAAGETVAVPFDRIVGWEGDPAAENVSFHYWRLKRVGGGIAVSDVRTMHVSP
jgi:hypothetical protein